MLILCSSVSKNNIDNFWKSDSKNQKATTNMIKIKKIINIDYDSQIPIVVNKNVKLKKKKQKNICVFLKKFE